MLRKNTKRITRRKDVVFTEWILLLVCADGAKIPTTKVSEQIVLEY